MDEDLFRMGCAKFDNDVSNLYKGIVREEEINCRTHGKIEDLDDRTGKITIK
jgi:hypothetical protein